eukprot:IDg5649t1
MLRKLICTTLARLRRATQSDERYTSLSDPSLNPTYLVLFYSAHPKQWESKWTYSASAYFQRANTCTCSPHREVINTFYMNCPTDCVLNPTQDPENAEVSKYAAQLLDTDMHKSSVLFEKAWMAACRVCRARANDGALSTLQDIAEKRPLAVLPQVCKTHLISTQSTALRCPLVTLDLHKKSNGRSAKSCAVPISSVTSSGHAAHASGGASHGTSFQTPHTVTKHSTQFRCHSLLVLTVRTVHTATFVQGHATGGRRHCLHFPDDAFNTAPDFGCLGTREMRENQWKRNLSFFLMRCEKNMTL